MGAAFLPASKPASNLSSQLDCAYRRLIKPLLEATGKAWCVSKVRGGQDGSRRGAKGEESRSTTTCSYYVHFENNFEIVKRVLLL